MARKLGRRGAGAKGYRAARRTIALVREGGRLFKVAPKPDLGTDERAERQGGVLIGHRQLENGATVDGAWANACGPLDELVHDGRMGTGKDRERRQLVAQQFRRTFAAARYHVVLSGGYLQRVGGVEGINPEAEDREQRARNKLNDWSKLIGPSAYSLLFDLLVLEQPVHPYRVGVVVWALDRIAVELRLG